MMTHGARPLRWVRTRDTSECIPPLAHLSIEPPLVRWLSATHKERWPGIRRCRKKREPRRKKAPESMPE